MRVKGLPGLAVLWVLVAGCAGPDGGASLDDRRRAQKDRAPGLTEPAPGIVTPAAGTGRDSRRPSSTESEPKPTGDRRVPPSTVPPSTVPPSTVPPAEEAEVSGPDGPAPARKNRQVEAYLRELQGAREQAEATYLKLWEVPRHFVPYLVQEVGSTRGTALKELKLLVLNTDSFVKLDPQTQDILGYNIPGMGDVVFDEIASGKVARGYRVTLRHRRGFSLGVVLRAALINRFRSTDYPAGDARERPVEWWEAFYRRVRDTL